MRILLVSNTTLRCGVAQMGRRMFCALTGAKDEGWESIRVGRRGDLEVAWWPADHPLTLPDSLEEFDVVHLNYHPGTIGHITPTRWGTPKLSVFFHEPGTGSAWFVAADLKITASVEAGAKYLPVPVPDLPLRADFQAGAFRFWGPNGEISRPIKIGHSSIRRDGIDWVQPVIERHPDWRLECSEEWLSDAQEVERLAACDLSIFHPHSGNPGQSSAVVMGIAARRPLLINSSPMLRTLWDSPEVYRYEDPEAGIQAILADLRAGRARYPLRLAEERSWKVAAERLQGWWKELVDG
jgi:hypothetical protein